LTKKRNSKAFYNGLLYAGMVYEEKDRKNTQDLAAAIVKYRFIPLEAPHLKGFLPPPFSLDELHLTIFKQTDRFGLKNDVHGTATINCGDGRRIKLRMFFDKRADLIEDPAFFDWVSHGSPLSGAWVKKEDGPVELKHFVYQAVGFLQKVILTMKHQIQKEVNSLLAAYDKSAEKAQILLQSGKHCLHISRL